jgi:hypothetical protein
MSTADFKTIPEELLFAAEAARSHLATQGYDVEVEGRHLGFPLTPALICKRGHQTLIVEVASSLDEKRVGRWIKYARSQTKDTRLSIVIRPQETIASRAMTFAAKQNIGLCVYDDDTLTEVRQPADLAVQIDLPELDDLPEVIRPILAPAFMKFAQQDWRDGLSDAYQAAEDHSREYLKTEIDAGRVTIVVRRSRRNVTLTAQDVNGMTLGQLKDSFGLISNQTHKEAIIHGTLETLNKIRPKLAHHKHSDATETALRASVGNHMYTVITCLEEIFK